MLQNLYVKNLALIDEIEVGFQPGLNILTGETGAGKSIILGSVNLALGGRYNADMLRTGAPYGLVELTFLIENNTLLKQLEKLDIYPENGLLTLSRRLMDGRSVSKINGETVTKNVLQEVAGLLIDIHGQHEHQTLLSKKNHLALLDIYARDTVRRLKEETAVCYKKYRKCKRNLEESDMDEAERKKEISFLEFEIGEIEDASLQPNEDEELEERYCHMTNGRKLSESTAEAYQYTSGDSGGNASDLLSRSIHALSHVEKFDERGGELYRQLLEIDSLLNDFNRELSEYEKSLEYPEEELYQAENRLNEINHLKVKYGNSVGEIFTYLAEKQQRLAELQNYETYLGELKQELVRSEADLQAVSEKLTKAREKAAAQFVKEICQGLKELNFLDVRFEMRFATLEKYSANGVDEAEFYISTNPGEPIKPLGSIASGGELSRVMLAVKTVLADEEETPTLIFDEIDAGISGITAAKVAQKMRIIGKKCQVICITHLPQIAAMADVHYLIEKSTDKKKTKTDIICLDEDASINELARILGGEKITGNILVSAREMKELAKSDGTES